MRSREADQSYCTALGKQSGPCEASVCLDRPADLRRAATENDSDFAFQIYAGEIVIALLRQMQSIANESVSYTHLIIAS